MKIYAIATVYTDVQYVLQYAVQYMLRYVPAVFGIWLWECLVQIFFSSSPWLYVLYSKKYTPLYGESRKSPLIWLELQ